MNALANALIVVDVLNDFCPGGSLAVEHGDEIAARIRRYMDKHSDEYVMIIASKCWHPANYEELNFEHFSEVPDFVTTWPVHGVAGTEGAEFHPNLGAMNTAGFRNHGVRPTPIGPLFEFDKIFYKGQKSAAYSAFEGVDAPVEVIDAMSLHDVLQKHRIGHVDVVGIATDHCVRATAMDAVKLGYDTTVLLSMCAGVHPQTTAEAVGLMAQAGVHIRDDS